MSAKLRQIERDWIAAAEERDRLKAELRAAKRAGDAEAVTAAQARCKDAGERCRTLTAEFRSIVGLQS